MRHEWTTDFRGTRHSYFLHDHGSSEEGAPTGSDRISEGTGHTDWISRTRDSSVQQHTVEPPLHNLAGVRRQTDACINDHRNGWRAVTKFTQSTSVPHYQAGARSSNLHEG